MQGAKENEGASRFSTHASSASETYGFGAFRNIAIAAVSSTVR